MEPFLSGLGDLKIKGYVHLQAHRDGELIYEHEQPNMWLDEGTRRLGWKTNYSSTDPYVCISSNTIQPQYIDTVIPGVYTSIQHAPTREDSYRRWKFQVTYSAPSVGTSRNINTVGISYNSNGTSAYCYTVLTSPFIQDDKTTLTVFYYVYVNVPQNNRGYGKERNLSLFYQLFYTGAFYFGYYFLGSGNYNEVFADECMPANAYIRELNSSQLPQYITTNSTQSYYINFNWTKLKYDTNIISVGSNSDLGSWLNENWLTIFNEDLGGIKTFNFDSLGRVWGKRYLNTNGTASGVTTVYYDYNYITNGYMKAFQVKAKEYPFNYSINLGKIRYRLYPKVDGNLEDTAPTGIAKYYLRREHYYSGAVTVGYNWVDSDASYRSTIMSSEVYLNKFNNRNFCCYSTLLKPSPTTYYYRGTHIFNIDTFGQQCSSNTLADNDFYSRVLNSNYVTSDYVSYFVYDNISEYSNKFYTFDTINNNGQDIWKYESDDSSLNTISYTKVATIPSGYECSHAIISPDKKMLIWSRINGKVLNWDIETNTFSDSWVNPSNVYLGNSSFNNYINSFGGYNPDTNKLYMECENSLLVMDKDGLIDYNNFNGTADFSKKLLKDWSFISNTNNASIRTENNKLYMGSPWTTSTNSYVGWGSFGGSILGHYIKENSEFEFTTYISNTFIRTDFPGLCGLFAYELDNLQSGSTLSGRTISLLRGNSEGGAKVHTYYTKSASSTTVMSNLLQAAPTRGPKLSVATSGSLFEYGTTATSITNPTRVFDGVLTDNSYTYPSSSNNSMWFTWKFNEPTVCNRYEIYNNNTSTTLTNSPNSWTVYGSYDNITWETIDIRFDMTDFGIRERRAFFFNNSEAYTYYKFSFAARNSLYLGEIELYYDDESLFASQNLPIRLKIKRDISNIVKTYYTLDDISIDDFSASWTEIGLPYEYSGRMLTGLCSGYHKSWDKFQEFEVSEFKMNEGLGNIDRRINAIDISCYADLAKWFSKWPVYNNYVSGDSRVVSKYGTVLEYDNMIHCITRKGIVSLNSSFEFENINWYKQDKSETRYYGYFYKDEGMAAAFLMEGNFDRLLVSSSNFEDQNKTFRFTKIGVYEPLKKNWAYQISVGSRVNTNTQNCADTGFIYKNSLWQNAIASQLSTTTYFYSYNVFRILDYQNYDWDEINLKWYRISYDVTPVGKLTHSDWQDLTENIQVKCNNLPSNPNSTFSNLDRYDFIAVKNGFSKDNQQYFTGLRLLNYFADARRETQTFVQDDLNPVTVITLDGKINNPISWMMADFDAVSNVQFVNKTTLEPNYFSNYLTGLDISTVVDQSTFKSISTSLSKGYNYYFGSYIRYGSEVRKIVTYDDYDKSFIVDRPFDTVLSSSITFDIITPAKASKVSSITGVNQYIINETNGTVTIHSSDTDKTVIIDYIYLLRSW